MDKKISVKQVKSNIGITPRQKATLVALGLRKVHAERVHSDNSVVRGMIDKVRHLVQVSEVK